MKEKIVYGLIFIMLFAIVSAGMIYFNSKYKNIFAFDFSPRIDETQQVKKDLAKVDSLKVDSSKTVTDSLKVNETTTEKTQTTQTKTEEKPVTKVAEQTNVQTISNEVPFRMKESEIAKAKKDSIYNEWIKQTVKLYESMDSKKAAKVIVGYSDNIARDILLKMKKKKAAEILAELKPDVVTRIISVN